MKRLIVQIVSFFSVAVAIYFYAFSDVNERIPSSTEEGNELTNVSELFFSKQNHSKLELPDLFLIGDLAEWRKQADVRKIPYVSFVSNHHGQYRTIFYETSSDFDRWVLAVGQTDQIEHEEGYFTPVQNNDKAKLLDLILLDKTTKPAKIFSKNIRLKMV